MKGDLREGLKRGVAVDFEVLVGEVEGDELPLLLERGCVVEGEGAAEVLLIEQSGVEVKQVHIGDVFLRKVLEVRGD